jgi:uncharacterized protein YlxW (UPF0749 family)
VKAPRARAAMTVVAFIMGLLLVLQLRAQGSAGGLGQLSAQDLTTLIASLNLRNGQLRDEVALLEAQLRDMSDATANGRTNVGQLEADLLHLRLWSGLEPVQGRGLVVVIDGPITADAVNDLVDELRLAGAEAIVIGDVRVVPGSVVAGEPGALVLVGAPLGPEVRIEAIGSPSALQAILSRAGGIVSRIAVAQPDVVIEVMPRETPLVLPATTRDLRPKDAKPRI